MIIRCRSLQSHVATYANRILKSEKPDCLSVEPPTKCEELMAMTNSVGHSYGGIIITAVADRLPHRVRRLVYWNAFVPNDGESVYDMLTPQHIALLSASAAERSDGSIMLPFQVWRETLINDVDLETAQ